MSPHPDMLPGPLALSRNDLAFPADAAEEAAAAVLGGGGGVLAKPPPARSARGVWFITGFFFFFLFCFAESLAGNWDEDDFLARIRDPKRCTRFGITPPPGLLSLVADASHGSLRTVSKMQSLVPRVVNDIRATGRNKSAGRCRLLH